MGASASLSSKSVSVPPTRGLTEFSGTFSQRASQLSWLLGAGASAQSFVPTAAQLIDLLLKHLYCREHHVSLDQVDLTDPLVRRRIHTLYSGQGGLPDLDDTAFYSAVFERAFTQPQDRASFVERWVRDTKPNYGHHVLAALAATGLASLVVTTNFDPLVERALNPALDEQLFEGRQLEVADLDNAGRALSALAASRWPLLVKIHGDYRSERLKNLAEELLEQDEQLRRAVTGALGRFGLVVVGYSGRDVSVMRMLSEALELSTPFPGGLFWVHRPQDNLASQVTDLLCAARSAGVDAVAVQATSFVELMTQLALVVELPDRARRWLAARTPEPIRGTDPPLLAPAGSGPQIRLNAIPVLSLPDHARALDWATPQPISRLRSALRAAGVNATLGFADGRPVAFGPDELVQSALAPVGITMAAKTAPLRLAADCDNIDSQAVGLVSEALAVGLGRIPGLTHVLRGHGGHQLRIRNADSDALSGIRSACGGLIAGELHVAGRREVALPWAEAVTLTLEARNAQWWLLLTPEIWTRPSPLSRNGQPSPSDDETAELRATAKEFIRARLANRYNRQYGELLQAWVRLVLGSTGGTIASYRISDRDGVDAVVVLGSRAAMSRPLLTYSGTVT